MSKKLLIHSLSILLLTSCAPQIGAMIRDGSDDIDVVKQSCSTCYDSKTKDQFVSLSCGHSTCKECLQRTIDIAIKDQSTKNIRCFSCWTHIITQEEIAKIVTPEQQEKLGAIQLKEWLAKQSRAKYCPTPDCNFAFINESRCQSTIDCPQCKKEYCSACLIKHPEYLSCAAAQEHYASAEDKANQSWKQQNSKPCPQCNASIEKNYGCDHMTCSKCRYEFCWKCLEKYPCPQGYSCRGPLVATREPARNNALTNGPIGTLQAQSIAMNQIEQNRAIAQQPEMPAEIRNLQERLTRLTPEALLEYTNNVLTHLNNTTPGNNNPGIFMQELERTENQRANIEVRADMPRDFHGFARMLHDAGIQVHVNQNGTLRITAHMLWDTFNRILEQANALYR